MDYLAINKALWNQRTKIHIDSDFYDMKNFMAGRSSLKFVELDLLGDIHGKKILHLQCHFGQDSLSLARMGADVTGVDLSDEAIREARRIAAELGIQAEFVNCDLYDLHNHLEDHFDVVFTSYGTIGWLPDLDRWAAVVDRYLKPGGQFIMAEFHPVIWMYDPGFTHIEYSYFKEDPIIETEIGTYADKDAPIALDSVSWNHSISETLEALLQRGLLLRTFREYPFCTYDIFPDMVETGPGQYQVRGLEGKLPMVYAFKMEKPKSASL